MLRERGYGINLYISLPLLFSLYNDSNNYGLKLLFGLCYLRSLCLLPYEVAVVIIEKVGLDN